MTKTTEDFEIVIVGAGPVGLACAIECEKNKLKYTILEKSCLANTIYHYPTNTILFSSPELLEIGDIPFIISTEKPTRNDTLNYYRRVADYYNLKIRQYEKVERVEGAKNDFWIKTNRNRVYRSNFVVIATGQYDNPNYLNVPGENLTKVSHYYTEGHPFYRQHVAVIGGQNSAVEAALDLYRHGAYVTLIHRRSSLGDSVKYWIRPNIENRIKENKIRALFNTVVKEITEEAIVVQKADGTTEKIRNDFVFAMTGYRPNLDFLKSLGIKIESNDTPVHNPETLETNIPGMYIAGVITAGAAGSKLFIENSRHHGKIIIDCILRNVNS